MKEIFLKHLRLLVSVNYAFCVAVLKTIQLSRRTFQPHTTAIRFMNSVQRLLRAYCSLGKVEGCNRL